MTGIIYRRVPISDTPTEKGRLPETFGEYMTNLGMCKFYMNIWYDKYWCEGVSNEDRVEWWEEPVDLPTEEEIMKEGESYKQYSMGGHPCTDIEIFHRNQGAKWVINKILNKK